MSNPVPQEWFVYLVRTASGTLYCGVSNDVAKRFAAHQKGTGAKYLKGKGPLELVWQHEVKGKSEALKLEYQIKKFPKAKKEKLVLGAFELA